MPSYMKTRGRIAGQVSLTVTRYSSSLTGDGVGPLLLESRWQNSSESF